MNTAIRHSRTLLILILFLISVPALLLAGDVIGPADNPADNPADSSGNDGDDSIIYEGGVLTIISRDGDDISTQIIDLEAMGMMASDVAGEVMSDVQNVLAELDDMQIQFRMGQDNRLNLSFDESEFELDLDAIMSQVALAMESGFGEFQTDEWASREDRDEISEDDLRAELHDLKAEIRELRREIERAVEQNK